jgi:hypothetical protein
MVRPAVALVVIAQAAQGTDFCGLKGLRTTDLMTSCKQISSEEVHHLSTLTCMWSVEEEDVRKAEPTLRRILTLCGKSLEGVPRRRTHSDSLKSPPLNEILKILWTGRYWLGTEPFNTDTWGFLPNPTAQSHTTSLLS